LQVGKANEELTDLLADYRRASLLVFLAVLPASFIGGAWVTGRALRPVQRLTRVVEEIVETDRLDARVPSGASRDELEALVQLFNKMLNRIDTLVREMRESLDNVAHDLRTPLTRLRHTAQSILSGEEGALLNGKCAGCQLALDKLADCVEEADRVGAILNALVDIAEAEARLVTSEIKTASLDTLVREVIAAYADVARASQVEIASSVGGKLTIRMDTTALFRVLTNLLDNAIKYTPAGGRVLIRAEAVDQIAEVSVSDTGIGIAPEDLPRIWERLFRSDRSRSQRGMGLGLSLVQAIVGAHGGTVAAESKVGVGTTVRLRLPLAGDLLRGQGYAHPITVGA
jgi:signal transduction histidine kinase